VPGVVVDEQSRWSGAAPADSQRVWEARVGPPAVGGVPMLGVLAVMDQEGGAAREPASGGPASRTPREVIAERRLVVGLAAEARAIPAQPLPRAPVPGRRPGRRSPVDAPGHRGEPQMSSAPVIGAVSCGPAPLLAERLSARPALQMGPWISRDGLRTS